MTVLVTGAPGWLGTRLVRRLIHQGVPVRCLIYPSDWSLDDAAQRLHGAELMSGDIRNEHDVARAMRGVQCVMHLAGARHPWRTNALRTINVDGTRVVARAARQHGVEHIIHASSISVFGNNTRPDVALTETDRPSPRTAYGRTKLWSESALRLSCGNDVATTILRPGPFYGPGQSASFRLLSRLVLTGTAPDVAGSVARQSLAHVDNVVDAFIAAYQTPNTGHRTALIADARPYSMAELLAAVADAHSQPLRTLPVPMLVSRAAERVAAIADQAFGLHVGLLTMAGEFGRNRWCDVRHAKTELGYVPKRDLEVGMREAWAEENATERV